MKNVIAPGAVSSAANPLLDFWAQTPVVDGDFTYFAPAAPSSLAFQIFDVRNTDEPAQVFPASVGDRQPVDLTADRVGGIVGHYAAAWTCSISSEARGRYQIRWFYTPALGAPESMTVRDFDVLPAALSVVVAGDGYIIPSDMRDEGVTVAMAGDGDLIRKIDRASRFIDTVTRRSFAPIYKTVQVLRGRSRALLLGEPVIALARVTIDGVDLARDVFRVSNRHLAANMLEPDDRMNPSIEIWSSAATPVYSRLQVFGRGSFAVGGPWSFESVQPTRMVTIRGLFGFTEYDGSPTGRTPTLIQRAAQLLVMRDLESLASPERETTKMRARLTSERTRDQSYTVAEAPQGGGVTGDVEIDAILDTFTRSRFALGSA